MLKSIVRVEKHRVALATKNYILQQDTEVLFLGLTYSKVQKKTRKRNYSAG